jgi:hypothetical protein
VMMMAMTVIMMTMCDVIMGYDEMTMTNLFKAIHDNLLSYITSLMRFHHIDPPKPGFLTQSI